MAPIAFEAGGSTEDCRFYDFAAGVAISPRHDELNVRATGEIAHSENLPRRAVLHVANSWTPVIISVIVTFPNLHIHR